MMSDHIKDLDNTFRVFKEAEKIVVPKEGWLRTIRKSLGMTLEQVAANLNMSKQRVSDLELRESSGLINLNSLRKMAKGMDMKLVYAIVPKDQSLESLIESKAELLAQKMVSKADTNKDLEAQGINQDEPKTLVNRRKRTIKDKLPKNLWN